MNKQTYDNMLRYSEYSSWALWNQNNITDTSVIDKSIDKLQPGIVLLFPNPASSTGNLDIKINLTPPGKERMWHVFHCDSKMDRRLRKLLSNTNREGAYMTDIVKNFASNGTTALEATITNEQINMKENVSLFVDEILSLNTDTIELFFFGRSTERVFNQYVKTDSAYSKIRGKIKLSADPYVVHPSPGAIRNDATYFQRAREQLRITV